MMVCSRWRSLISLGFLFQVSDFPYLAKMTLSHGVTRGKLAFTA
jgi:hypothetical protein